MEKILTMMATLGTLGTLFAAPSNAATADVQGDATAAENKVIMCTGCHAIPGYKTSFPEVYHVPYLGDQNARYVESVPHTYQRGDHEHPTICAIARSLTDQDIADPTAYYAAQTPATQDNPQK